jgi:hypothetical protein
VGVVTDPLLLLVFEELLSVVGAGPELLIVDGNPVGVGAGGGGLAVRVVDVLLLEEDEDVLRIVTEVDEELTNFVGTMSLELALSDCPTTLSASIEHTARSAGNGSRICNAMGGKSLSRQLLAMLTPVV